MNSRHIALTALFSASLLVNVLGLPLRVRSETGANSNPPPQKIGKDNIDQFCDQSTNTPQSGLQFDGKKADETVMKLQPGKYEYPNEGAMLLFLNQRYLLKLPTDRNGIYGTDGDDLLFAGGIVGGCSLEQLSEAISRNSLDINDFKWVKSYK